MAQEVYYVIVPMWFHAKYRFSLLFVGFFFTFPPFLVGKRKHHTSNCDFKQSIAEGNTVNVHHADFLVQAKTKNWFKAICVIVSWKMSYNNSCSICQCRYNWYKFIKCMANYCWFFCGICVVFNMKEASLKSRRKQKPESIKV